MGNNERHERSDLITIIIRINMDENERSRRKYGDDSEKLEITWRTFESLIEKSMRNNREIREDIVSKQKTFDNIWKFNSK